jgi:hypothetical protein
MRSTVATSVLEVGGLTAIVVGAAQVSAAVAWIVGGVLGLALSWRLSR